MTTIYEKRSGEQRRMVERRKHPRIDIPFGERRRGERRDPVDRRES